MAHILAAQIHMTIIWVFSLSPSVTDLGGIDNRCFPTNPILFFNQIQAKNFFLHVTTHSYFSKVLYSYINAQEMC